MKKIIFIFLINYLTKSRIDTEKNKEINSNNILDNKNSTDL